MENSCTPAFGFRCVWIVQVVGLDEDNEQGPVLRHDLGSSGAGCSGDVFSAHVGYSFDVPGHHSTRLAARQRDERNRTDLGSAGTSDVHGGAMVHISSFVHAAVCHVQELQVRDHLRAVDGEPCFQGHVAQRREEDVGVHLGWCT